MALKSELMAMGMPAAQARVLGFDPPVNVTASGSTISNATLLSGNHAIISAGTPGGVQIADAQQMWYVQNSTVSSGTVYPPTGNSFSGLTSNTGIAVPANKALFIEPGGTTGITWSVSA